MATTPRPSASSRACSPRCSGRQVDDEDDEGASAPAPANEKPRSGFRRGTQPRSPPIRCRRRAPSRRPQRPSAGFGRRPDRSGAKAKSDQADDQAGNAEPKPQTPADIINARGFWDDDADDAERRPRPPRSPPSAPARRSPPPPIRNRPPASPNVHRRWPMRRRPLRRSTAPTSSPPPRRSRAASRPSGAQCRRRRDRNQHRGRQGRAGSGQRGRDLDPPRRRHRATASGCAS